MRQLTFLGFLLVLTFLTGCASARETTVPPAEAPASQGLYPPQDLSVIAKTNRVQFLNVYANW